MKSKMILKTLILTLFIKQVICKEYSIHFWNRCHDLTYVNIYNVALNTCLSECWYRRSCKGVQFSRVQKVCGLLTSTEMTSDLKICPKYVYITRDIMGGMTDSCGPYQMSELTNECITDCEVSENPRNYSKIVMTAKPKVGTRIKIVCETQTVQMTSTCGSDGHFDRLPNCDPYIGQNLAFQKETIQSTTHSIYSSDLAVDENNETVHHQVGCSHTLAELRPWLIVDLNNVFYVENVAVLKREDCCTNRFTEAYVYTSTNKKELMSDNVWNAGTLCAYKPGAVTVTEQPVVFNCSEGVRGKYVKIVLNKTGPLEICDIQINGHFSVPVL